MPSRVTSLIRWSALLLVVACSSSSVAEAQDSRDAPVAQASAPAQVAQQAPGSAPSSLPRRTMTAVRLNEGETIDLDGDLDEGVWARALPASDFRQQDPDNGEAATEPTEVRIVFGEDALYMGVICFDSEPDRWLGYQRGRDGSLTADDRFMWTIDTFLDGRSSYFFEMNPSGLMADALRGVGTSNRQWDGIWTGRAGRTEIGWTLEIEIPFRTLNFDPDSDTWGINFQRTVRRKNEESLWMGWLRNQGLTRMTNAGLLTGIDNVSQGLGLDIKPYLVGTAGSAPGRGEERTSTDVDYGVDLFYNVTPGLRANLTVNTDFAQTEVDQRQVNLTRFSLFFPERRDFFLDGSLFFDFADAGANWVEVAPFFSRRIGLDENGNPQTVNFGAKLTGQAGAFDVGVLQVQTGREGEVPGEDFTVLRTKRRLLSQSYVGALYTRRAARDHELGDRHTVGLDFDLATSTFLGSENLGLKGFYLHTTNLLATGKNAAYGLELDFPNDPLSVQLEYREIQDNYDAAVGFTRRTGVRSLQPQLGYTVRPQDHAWVRELNFGGRVEWAFDPDDNTLLTRDGDVTALQIDLHSQDSMGLHVVPAYEVLEKDFDIAPGVTLPRGQDYRFMRYRVEANTANRRVIALSPRVEWGEFFSGDRLELGVEVAVRARPGVMFTLAHEWNRVSLSEGRFYTKLYRGIAETQFSPWLSLVNNVQYDTQSAVLAWQSRLRWIMRPGNDLYVVYLHNWLDDPLYGRFTTLNRRAASKVLYTHRF